MCDDSPAERQYWMRKVEQLRKQMEREELERQRKAATAPPAKPEAGTGAPEPVPALRW
jgi:hypothetical protein